MRDLPQPRINPCECLSQIPCQSPYVIPMSFPRHSHVIPTSFPCHSHVTSCPSHVTFPCQAHFFNFTPCQSHNHIAIPMSSIMYVTSTPKSNRMSTSMVDAFCAGPCQPHAKPHVNSKNVLLWLDKIHFGPFRIPGNDAIPLYIPTNNGFNHGFKVVRRDFTTIHSMSLGIPLQSHFNRHFSPTSSPIPCRACIFFVVSIAMSLCCNHFAFQGL